jgi:hypothetical protein
MGGYGMGELDMFNEDIDKFLDMNDDWDLNPKDYYDVFSKMCLKYSDSSIVPYSLCHELITGEYPCEEYYMQMLMDVYSYYNIGEDFLDLLQRLIDDGYCTEYQKKTHELIKDNIQDGFVIAYRGEYAIEDKGNLDYKQSVSYSLDYEQAKVFSKRFNMLPLTKSVVYTVKVPVDDVLAYIDREDEVVCVPICMGGKMEVIKEESFL